MKIMVLRCMDMKIRTLIALSITGTVLAIAALSFPARLQAERNPAAWTETELSYAISHAKTGEEHERIAQYYTADAIRLDVDAMDEIVRQGCLCLSGEAAI